MVCVENGLKHQGEIMEKILHQMDKRFEQVDKRFEHVDRRFDQVDKRFEELREDMSKRFSQLQWTIGLGFTIMAALMGIINFF